MNTKVQTNEDSIEMEWSFEHPERTRLTPEMEETARNFIKSELQELDHPSEFGSNSVEFNDRDIFISYNKDSHVFECYAGW